MAYVAKLTINNSAVTADLTDFPVYVNLADMPSSFWNTVANGGGDIRVYKSDGTTELPREVRSCNTANDTGALYFKYTGTLSGSSDTEVQIHADGTSSDYAVTDTYGRNNVWNSAYKAVYHMEASSSSETDSTGNGNTLTDNNTVASATGKIENGRDFERANSEYFSLADGSQTGLDFSSAFTFEMWVNIESAPTSGQEYGLVAKDTTGSQGYYWYYFNNGGTRQLITDVWTNNTTHNQVGRNIDLGTATWKHIAVTFTANGTTSTSTKYYVDGVESTATQTVFDNGNITSIQNSTASLGIGSRVPTASGFFDGIMDEVRLSNVVRSTDWITTSYNNQSSPSTFYTATAPTTRRVFNIS